MLKRSMALFAGVSLLGLGVLGTAWNIDLHKRLKRLEAQQTPLFRGASGLMTDPKSGPAQGREARRAKKRSEPELPGSALPAVDEASPRDALVEQSREDAEVPLDIRDPRVRGALATYLEEHEQEQRDFERGRQQDEYLDFVEARTLAFAEEFGVDESVAADVVAEIEVRTEEWLQAQYAGEDEDLPWSDAKAKQKSVEADGRSNLVDLLGEELYVELESRVWGPQK